MSMDGRANSWAGEFMGGRIHGQAYKVRWRCVKSAVLQVNGDWFKEWKMSIHGGLQQRMVRMQPHNALSNISQTVLAYQS